jgi:hypothetical protein
MRPVAISSVAWMKPFMERAVCRARTELLWITHEEPVHLCHRPPAALSFHLRRLITRRPTENTMAATRGGTIPETGRAGLSGT